MKRIFFFDIDNTLLDHETMRIPESALNAIAALKASGHMVNIATGRSHEHASPFIEQISPAYTITQNGARIFRGNEAVFGAPLPREPLVQLLDWADTQGIPFGVNNGYSAYLNTLSPLNVPALESVNMPYQTEERFYLERDVYQAWLFYDESEDTRFSAPILEGFPMFDLIRWHQSGVDIISKGINKWTGCLWVLQQTGFSPDKSISFGDGLNDMEMIENSGLGIAMGNGHPLLKARADYIAPAIHLDGISSMLVNLRAQNIIQ